MKLFNKKIISFIVIIMICFIGIINVGAACRDNKTEDACKTDSNFACVWNENKIRNYCNTDNLTYVACGDAYDIPSQAPALISFAVNLLKIATPIILIIVSIITLLKAVTASKEDEIKKAQNSLIRKIVAAALIFFVTSIVQFVILKVADNAEANSISSCMSCFLNNDCSDNVYYKSAIGSEYRCTYLKSGEEFSCK